MNTIKVLIILVYIFLVEDNITCKSINKINQLPICLIV